MLYKSMQRVIALLVCFVGLPSNRVQHTFAAQNVLDQVSGLFAVVDGASENTSPTESAYDWLQKLKPRETASDPVHYAYLLGLVELHKQRDAIAYAGEMIERDPSDVRARLLRARLLLREKKFAEVFVDLETSGRLLAERTKKEPLDAETETACRALGLMFGYLEGPAKPMMKATLGTGIKDRLMDTFSLSAKQAFNEQYEAVLEEQKELINKGEDAFRKMQAKHREDIEAAGERRAQLEAQKSEFEQNKQALIDDLTKKWDAAKAEYNELAPVYWNMRNTQAQAIVQREWLAGQAVAAWPRGPERDNNCQITPEEQFRYDREKQHYFEMLRQVNRADQQIRQGATALQQLWNQGTIAEARLARLHAEGQHLGMEFSLKERAFAKQEAKLDRNDRRKQKLPTAPAEQLGQTFVQYDDYNYLHEKQRLLDSLLETK